MSEENAEDQVVDPQTEASGGSVTPESKPDDYHKNKAMEFERKFTKTAAQLEQTNERLEKLSELIQTQNSGEQYTEEQLKAAKSNPDLTPEQATFIERKLGEIESKKLQDRDNQLLNKIEKTLTDKETRSRAENDVANDPRFADAFEVAPNGSKKWKQDSPLAQAMVAYMQDPSLKDRPDAITVAAKLAYSDMALVNTQNQAQIAQREAEKLKNTTMTQGGGVPHTPTTADSLQEAKAQLKAKPTKRAGEAALGEWFKKERCRKEIGEPSWLIKQ